MNHAVILTPTEMSLQLRMSTVGRCRINVAESQTLLRLSREKGCCSHRVILYP
jgi:hypothetical protein